MGSARGEEEKEDFSAFVTEILARSTTKRMRLRPQSAYILWLSRSLSAGSTARRRQNLLHVTCGWVRAISPPRRMRAFHARAHRDLSGESTISPRGARGDGAFSGKNAPNYAAKSSQRDQLPFGNYASCAMDLAAGHGQLEMTARRGIMLRIPPETSRPCPGCRCRAGCMQNWETAPQISRRRGQTAFQIDRAPGPAVLRPAPARRRV